MAEIQVAQFDNRIEPAGDRSGGQALEALAGGVSDFRQESFGRDIRSTAAEVADQANQVRSIAESRRDAGETDPMLSSTIDQQRALLAQGDKISKAALKSFGRYKLAVEQGATNQAAARIAVQKEMRDMISNNPAYADVIRSAAAEAMGEEEFRTLSRDLAKPAKGPTLTETKYSADIRQAKEVALHEASLRGYDEEMTAALVAKQQARVTQTYSDTIQYDQLNALGAVDAKAVDQRMNIALRASQKLTDDYADSLYSLLTPGHGGMQLDIAAANNMAATIDAKILDISGELRQSMAGSSLSMEQINTYAEQVTFPLRQLKETIVGKDAGARIAQMRDALVANGEVSLAVHMPLHYAATKAFGDQAGLFIRALSGDAIGNDIWNNSSLFKDYRDIEAAQGKLFSAEERRMFATQRIGNAVTSIVDTDIGAPLSLEQRAGGSAYLGVLYNAPSAEREKSEDYGRVFNRLARMGDSLTGSEIARTNDPDKHQIAASKLWKRNFEAALASAARNGKRFVGDSKDHDYKVDIVKDGVGNVTIQTRRFQLGRDFDAAGKATETWRELPPIIEDASSQSYRQLFVPYSVDRKGTQRRPVDNPVIYEELFGNTTMDVQGYLDQSLDTANAGRSNIYPGAN